MERRAEQTGTIAGASSAPNKEPCYDVFTSTAICSFETIMGCCVKVLHGRETEVATERVTVRSVAMRAEQVVII